MCAVSGAGVVTFNCPMRVPDRNNLFAMLENMRAISWVAIGNALTLELGEFVFVAAVKNVSDCGGLLDCGMCLDCWSHMLRLSSDLC